MVAEWKTAFYGGTSRRSTRGRREHLVYLREQLGAQGSLGIRMARLLSVEEAAALILETPGAQLFRTIGWRTLKRPGPPCHRSGLSSPHHAREGRPGGHHLRGFL